MSGWYDFSNDLRFLGYRVFTLYLVIVCNIMFTIVGVPFMLVGAFISAAITASVIIILGLTGVRLIIGDKCLGMLESIPEVFPNAKYQRCTVHFYRNIFSATPRNKMKEVSMLLKAIHAQECKTSNR